MKTNTDLTLYTRTTKAKKEQWTRSVIPRVHWENTKGSSGPLKADSVRVHIPLASRTQLTMKPGDVIVNGVVLDEVDASVFTMTDLRAKYPGAATINSVDRYEFGSRSLWHLQVAAA